MFFKSNEALEGYVNNVGTVGVNGSLAAGPLGRQGEALITTGSKEGIMVFASSKGLYGGISLELSGVLVNKAANKGQYGRDILPIEILDSEERPKGEVFDKMYAALNDLMKQSANRAGSSSASGPASSNVVAQN